MLRQVKCLILPELMQVVPLCKVKALQMLKLRTIPQDGERASKDLILNNLSQLTHQAQVINNKQEPTSTKKVKVILRYQESVHDQLL